MSSKNEVTTALTAVDNAYRALVALPFQTLAPADQRALLVELDRMNKELAALQRRLLRRLVASAPPVEFAGAPLAEVLARRLRIPVAEAHRRIAEARSGPESEPKSA